MNRRSHRAVAVLACGLVGWLLAGATTPAAHATPSTKVDRVVRDKRIEEASGLAVDPYRPDVVWTLNDSGNAPELFAIGRDGRTRLRVRVKGAEDDDWEALQSWRAPTGQGLIVVGDIGDNRSGRTQVHLLGVPVGSGTGKVSVAPAVIVTLTYPDGPHDAETLLLDPRDGRVYIVTKGLFTGALYAVPPQVWTARAWRPGKGTVRRAGVLEKVVGIPMGLVTDGAVLGDGRIVLRDYGSVEVFPPASRMGKRMARSSHDADLPDQKQGEGMTIVAGPRGRAELLVGSEGAFQPLLRVALPGGPAPAPPLARSASPHAAVAPVGDPVVDEENPDDTWQTPALIIAAMVAGYWYLRKRKA